MTFSFRNTHTRREVMHYLIIFISLVVGALSIVDDNFAGGSVITRALPYGTYIIPNDGNYQTTTGALGLNVTNLKVYGLLARLISGGVPAWYIENSGKSGVSTADCSLHVNLIYPSIGGGMVPTFRSSAWAIPPAYTSTADTIIASYGNSVRVYNHTLQVGFNVNCPIRWAVTNIPRIALLPSSSITSFQRAEGYLTSLGLALGTDFFELNDAQTAGMNDDGQSGHCFTMLILPDTDASAYTANVAGAIHDMANGGVNVLALVGGAALVENREQWGYHATFSQCTSGCSAIQPPLFNFPSEPFTQVVTPDYCSTTTTVGKIQAYTGTINVNAEASVQVNVAGTIFTYANLIKLTGFTIPGGMAYYMMGEDWSLCPSTNVNYRMMGNAILTPSGVNTTCGLQQTFVPVANWDAANATIGIQIRIPVLTNDYDIQDVNLAYTSTNLVNPPNFGNVIFNSTGVYYVNTKTAAIVDTFQYRVSNSLGLQSAVTTVYVQNIQVSPGPPTVSNVLTTTLSNTITFQFADVLFQTNDPAGDPDIDTITIFQPPISGVATVVSVFVGITGNPYRSNVRQVIKYTPALGKNGIFDVIYKVTSVYGSLQTSTNSTARMVVSKGPGPALVAGSYAQYAMMTQPVSINILAGATVASPATLNSTSLAIGTISVTSNSSSLIYGSITISSANSTIIYTADINFIGQFTINYSACTNEGSCNSSVFTITINDFVDVKNLTFSLSEASSTTITVLGSLTNHLVRDTTFVLGTPSAGTITSTDPSTTLVNYNAPTCAFGTFPFSYTLCAPSLDARPRPCRTAFIIMNVTFVPIPPTLSNDAAIANKSMAVLINVAANDQSCNGALNLSSIQIITPDSHATITTFTNGTVSYQPINDTFIGMDTFTYQLCDTFNVCSNATVSVNITLINLPPVAVNDSYSVTGDSNVTFCPVLNDHDSDGNVLFDTLVVVTPPLNGTFVATNSCSATYTPNLLFYGIDTMQYKICDNTTNCSNNATIVFTVSQVPHDPIAVNDYFTCLQNGNAILNVLANDTDPDGNLVTTNIFFGTASHGGSLNLTLISSGFFGLLYTPQIFFSGIETFTYRVEDTTNRSSNFATVTVNVTMIPLGPVVASDSFTVLEYSLDNLLNIGANDFDPNNNTINWSSLNITVAPQHGSVTNLANGNVSYTPNFAYFGSDAFNYTVCSSAGRCSSQAKVSLTVSFNPLHPNATGVRYLVGENTFLCVDPTTNITVDNNLSLNKSSVVITLTPASGTVTFNGTSQMVCYTPNPSYVGGDLLTFSITDTNGQSTIQTVNYTVFFIEYPPIAVNDEYTVMESQQTSNMNVISNDIDPNNNINASSVILLGNPPVFGTLVNEGNGTFVYTPTDVGFGITSFIYQVCDTAGLCSNATVTINVTQIQHAPVTPDDFYTVYTDVTKFPMNVLANVTDRENNVDNSTLLVPSITPNGGITTINNTIVYYTSSSLSRVGWDNFTYYICDTTALCNTGNINVYRYSKVYPVNDVINYLTNGSEVCVNVLNNDIDYSNNINVSSISVGTPPAIGIFTNFGNGSLCFTHTSGTNITGFNVQYSVCTNTGYCASASLHVAPLNDCNANGIQDNQDLSSGTSKDCNGNGIPDECDISVYGLGDCNGDGIPDICQAICANRNYETKPNIIIGTTTGNTGTQNN